VPFPYEINPPQQDGAGLYHFSVGIKDFGERAPTVRLFGENETALLIGEGFGVRFYQLFNIIK
jgi:hypothetical protein